MPSVVSEYACLAFDSAVFISVRKNMWRCILLVNSRHKCFGMFALGAQTSSGSGTGGQGDDSEEEHAANQVQNEHGRASGAPDGTDRGHTGRFQDSGDYEAAMGNVLGSALTCQLRQPQIYKALGMDRPLSSIPVFQADRWLDSWHVIASSMPSQQAKLSRSASYSSILG